MTSETLISLFLAYPIGLAVNMSSDKIKEVANIIQIDSIEPLEKILIKSFLKAIDEHEIYFDKFDKNAQNLTKKLKDNIKKNKSDLCDIFFSHSKDKNLLYIMQDEDFRKEVASDVVSTYLEGIVNGVNISLDSIVLDCLNYYKNSFFKYMSEKEGIIALLGNSLEIRGELDKITRILNTQFQYHNFLEKYSDYKKSVINNFSEINFFGLGLEKYKKRKKRELNRIYVKPRFKKVNNEYFKTLNQQFIKRTVQSGQLLIDDEESDFTFAELLSSISENRNIVIIGDPGAGKSILVKYIMYLLLSGDKIQFVNKSIYDFIPFRIELRKYIKEKRVNKCSIIEYLKSILKSEYQIDLSDMVNLSDFFYANSTLIFFDGLDEIFDVNEKIEVRNDIINFINHYGNSKAVVTSRIIGYDDARFNEKFIELRILNFEDRQIEAYVKKWYCQDCKESENCKETCKKNIQDEISILVSEIDNLEDELKRNPLLLSLIIILYQNNGQLPNSKLELYKSCTKTLVDNWDGTKAELDIKINDSLKRRKENIFSALAFWQYVESSNEAKKIKIDNKSVLKQVEKTIKELELTDDTIEAKKWASEFIDYAEKRSLYFDNTFTHKTFWEYYTSLRIFQELYLNNEPKLYELIERYIENSFWFDVIELLFNMIDEVQCDNKKIKKLIEEIISRCKGGCVFILKIIPSIVNISGNTVKDVIKLSMSTCIVNLNDEKGSRKGNTLSYQIFEQLCRLGKVYIYHEKFQASFDEIYCKMTDEKLLLKYFLFYYEFNNTVEKNVIKLNNNKGLLEFKNKYPRIYIDSLISVEEPPMETIVNGIIEFCSIFGQERLYEPMPFFYIAGTYRTALMTIYLYRQFMVNNLTSAVHNISLILDSGIGIDLFKQLDTSIHARTIRPVHSKYTDYLDIINSTDNWNVILALLHCFRYIIKMIIMDKRHGLEEIHSIYFSHPLKEKIFKYIHKICGHNIPEYNDVVAFTADKD